MIELLPASLLASGAVPFDTVTLVADTYVGPLGYAANAPLGTTDAVAGTDIVVNGVKFTQAGRLRLVDATVSLPAGFVVQGGMAVSSDGQLCISTDVPAADCEFIGGVAVRQDGAVHATI